MRKNYLQKSIIASMIIWTMAMMPIAAAAQTQVSMPKNKYKVQDDVKLGRDYSVEIEKQFPVLNDRQANDYVKNVGARLVASIPQQFRQPAFDYNFQVVNASDINAFALPGGPMYVNRGMITAAKNEGEMAGVMAHEIAHVALRHSTAQATKQGSVGNQLGTLGLILGGAIFGGQAGAQAGAIAAAAWQTKYSRDYETQADYLGARIMADAGYDPRDLANMFQTIAGEGGGRGPEFLSSHPDPGNRFQKINQEAQRLRISPNPIKITREFERIQARMRGLPPARTMAQLQQDYKNNGGGGSGSTGQSAMSGGRYSNSVAQPSTQMRAYSSGNWIRLNVPSNWKEFGGESDVSFAPDGAYGSDGITHGAMLGLYRGQNNNLGEDTTEFVRGLMQSNSYLQEQSGLQNTRIAGRQAYSIVLSGTSPITRRAEVVTVYTVRLRNGETFYVASVTPQQDSFRYNNTFRNMISSIRLNDSN
jgi:Putative Zn-dependent protease, contains TPR repeats